MKRRAFLKRAGATAVAMATRGLGASGSADGRPNILFIMTDQQFADIMSCRMGRRYIHTPAMDSLAARGMLFTRAYTANPLCMPARASIFSGYYPHQTGVQVNGRHDLDVEGLAAMGTYFKRAGYDTGYVGKWHLCYSPRKVEEHGFDMTAVLRNNGHDDEMPAPAAAFIKAQRERPFLLVVSFSNPHDMCQLARGEKLPSGGIGKPPAVGQRPPLLENAEPPENETDTMTLMRESYQNSRMFPVGDYDEDEWRRLIWGYHRLTEKVDALIGKVLGALRESGKVDDTVVVFTSDHGDCHGAHRWNQKTVFYEESARVPLIVSDGRRGAGGTTDRLVNTGIDILPTLLDYAGIERPGALPGRSLRGIVEGRAPGSWRDYVVIQNRMIQGGPVNGETPEVQGRMVRSDAYKYCIYDRGQRREALFDMRSDPGEMRNLADEGSHVEHMRRHRSYLLDHARRHGDKLALEMLEAV